MPEQTATEDSLPQLKIEFTSICHLMCIISQYEVGRVDRPIMAGLAELRMGIGMGISQRVCHGTSLDHDVARCRGILLMIPAINLGLGVRMTKHVVGWSTGCECPVVHDVRGGGRWSSKATISMKVDYDWTGAEWNTHEKRLIVLMRVTRSPTLPEVWYISFVNLLTSFQLATSSVQLKIVSCRQLFSWPRRRTSASNTPIRAKISLTGISCNVGVLLVIVWCTVPYKAEISIIHDQYTIHKMNWIRTMGLFLCGW